MSNIDSDERFPVGSRTHGDAFKLFRHAQVHDPDGRRLQSGEHIWLADEGVKLACDATGESPLPYTAITRSDESEWFTYGELVALSGDFYESPEALFEETPGLLPWFWEPNDLSDLRTIFKEELQTIERQQRGLSVGYPDRSIALAWNAKSYVELALRNVDHFGWHNMKAYCRYHSQALELARTVWKSGSNDDSNPIWCRALFFNAFADHFLTDAFAAGHIRVPRREIRAWGERVDYSDKLSGALSKLLHDQDGHLKSLHHLGEELAQGDGLRVTNAVGVDWHTRCDGQLFIANGRAGAVVDQPVQAVALSFQELLNARRTGVVPPARFAAASHVPFPHPDSPTLQEKFSASMTDQAVAELVASTAWYVKVPWISAGLSHDKVRALFCALPELMSEFQSAVSSDVQALPELSRWLPPEYIKAFHAIS